MGNISALESSPAPTQVIEAPPSKPEDTYLKSLHRAASESSTADETGKPKREYANYTPPTEGEDDSLTRLSLQILAAGEKRDISDIRGNLKREQDSESDVYSIATTEGPPSFSVAETKQIDTSEVKEALKNAEQQEKQKPKSATETNVSGTPTPPVVEIKNTPEENKSLKSKIKDTASNLAWKTRVGIAMAAQFGALHPQRVDGRWVTVLEPWAKIQKPSQTGYPDESDYYANLFRDVPDRILDMKKLGGDDVEVELEGVGGIHIRDGKRKTAESIRADKAIVVKFVDSNRTPISKG